MNIETFAEKNRLKIRLDECGDAIIPGRRGGHLYLDDDKVCLMVVDGHLRIPAKWEALEAESLWLGSISRLPDSNRGVQDVKATGIPEAKWKHAIRMAGVIPKRVLSEAELEKRRALIEQNVLKRGKNAPEGTG
jgi:hypothetical protein